MDANIDAVLQWEDLANEKGAGMDILNKLHSLNYRTVSMLKALLATSDGSSGFTEITGLSGGEVQSRLARRHPGIETFFPSGHQYSTGYLPRTQRDPPGT